METESSSSSAVSKPTRGGGLDRDQIRVKKKTLQAVLEQCHRALELLSSADFDLDDDDSDDVSDVPQSSSSSSSSPPQSQSSHSHDDTREVSELCNILKSRVESPNFLEKLGSIHASVPQQHAVEEGSSWDFVSENDLRDDGYLGGDADSDQESYVLVRQEDILDGIACFTAAYLSSLKQTKELTPSELQKALSKTFNSKKKKGKLQKAWNGSKFIYNVASWGATAIGIYQNPALFRVASIAFWTSCNVVSKLF